MSSALIYALFIGVAFAVGSTGWPGHWFVSAVELATGVSLDRSERGALRVSSEGEEPGAEAVDPEKSPAGDGPASANGT